MKKLVVIVLAVIGFNMVCFAQEETVFIPSGKPTFKIFSNYHSTFSDGETFNEFEITRAYLGYEHEFNPYWSGKLILDVGNPDDDGDFEMTAYLKNALLSYKKNGLALNFGLISTTAFKVQEKFWAYRYLLKSFQDNYKYGSSADLGVSAAYQFSDVISADVIVANGEGYKQLEADSIFSLGLGVTLKPLERLTARAYVETTTGESDYVDDDGEEVNLVRQNTWALFLGYTGKNISLAAEFNKQNNNKKADGNDLTGYSFYSTYQMKSTKLFARYDILESKDDWNISNDGNLLVIGAEFNPVNGIKITPNYRNYSPANNESDAINYMYVSCEIKF
jgi:hypothetical protein